jgi:hypothetical protein
MPGLNFTENGAIVDAWAVDFPGSKVGHTSLYSSFFPYVVELIII